MTRCTACHRPLLHPIETPDGPMGVKCAARLHPKVAAVKSEGESENEAQSELWPGSIFSRAARFIAAWWNDVTEPGIHL